MANKNFKVKNGLEIGNSISITDAGVVSGLTTNNLSEGATNKYYTDARADARVAVGIANLVDSAPTTLDTLNELAAALGDDPNFATTVTTALGNKLNTADFNSTFDTRLATKTTTNLAEGTNLYYTTARANTDFDSRLATKSTTDLAEGTNLYYTDGRFDTRLATKTTTNLAEGTNLYYTDARVRAVVDNNVDLDVDGSNNLYVKSLRNATRVYGGMEASTNASYVFPPQTLSTVTDNNGYSAASSFPAGTSGYGANASFTHYYGDTLAGVNTAPAFNFRNANGNSSTGDLIPFSGLTSVAPSATLSGNVMGTLNYNGYGTTGFTNDIATTYQGGGINALSSMQVQSYPTENFSDSVLTLNSTNVTAVASSFRATMGSPTVVGTKGQIQYSGTAGAVGQAVRVTGTLTGNATGIVSGQTYYMIVYSNNGTNSFATLSATPGGVPITTSGTTLTGLTLTRCSVSFTTTGLTNVPFGRGALVTVSGITNVTDGTYPVWGTPTTTTFSIGVPHTVAPTVAGAQTFSCLTAYMGSGFRIRAFPTATPATLQNRLEVIDMAPGATTIRTNSLTLNTGAYGNTGVGITGNNIIYNRVHGQFELTTTVTPAAANTAYVFPLGTATLNNIATVGSTSRLIPGAAGRYNFQFSVQCSNSDNSNDQEFYIWLRKNGTDVAGSTGRMTLPKSTTGSLKIVGWNFIVETANATDYFELAYAVASTQVTFPAFSPLAFAPGTSSLVTTITPIGA